MWAKLRLSTPNIRNTFLILSCTPPSHLPSKQSQFVRAWTLQGVKSVPQGCWPRSSTMLPTVVSSWLDVSSNAEWLDVHFWLVADGGPFLIHTGNCWAWTTQQRCCSWHKPVRLAPTTILYSQALPSLSCTFHFLNGTHTQSVSIVSRLRNPPSTGLLPFIYTDWSWFNKWHLTRDP
jgi:hypothetical protein